MFPTFVEHTWSATTRDNEVLESQIAQYLTTDKSTSSQAFSITLSRLLELLEPEPEDERNGPTQHAFKNALTFIREAERLIGHNSLRGSASLDSHGGIRVTWRVGSRELRLICPATADEQMYLYREEGDNINTIEPLTAGLLVDSMSWLSNRGQLTRTAATSFDSV
jgi:hypothetical protein